MRYVKCEHELVPMQPQHKKRRAMLKSWSIIPTYRPGLGYKLAGYVYGHDTLQDGALVETSPLLRLDIPAHTAETINTIYLLG